MLSTLLFWTIALLTIAAAVFVVFARNVLHAAFGLMFTLAGVAGLFLYLGADFIAAAQFLVYVGGVTVLLVFAVMLTPGIHNKRFHESTGNLGVGLVATGLLATVLVGFVWWLNFGDRRRDEAGSPVRIAVLGESREAKTLKDSITRKATRQRGSRNTASEADRRRREGLWRLGLKHRARVRAVKRSVRDRPDLNLPLVSSRETAKTNAPGAGPPGWADLDRLAVNVGGETMALGSLDPRRAEHRRALERLITTLGLAEAVKSEDARIQELAFDDPQEFHATARPLGKALVGKYVVPFELLAIVLLAVMLAAIVIVRKELKGATAPPSAAPAGAENKNQP